MKIKVFLICFLIFILGSGIGFLIGIKTDITQIKSKYTGQILNEQDYLHWSHTDLLKYLQKNSLNFNAEQTTSGSFWGTPMLYKSKDGEVYVRLHETSEQARSMASNLGTTGFSWGNFMFRSENENILKNISSVLDNKYNDDYEFLKTIITTENSEEKESANKKENISERLKLEETITGYYTGNGIWAPSVVLTFRNISDQDITTPVVVEVVFFDEAENNQLSAKKRPFIGGLRNTRLAAGNSHKINFTSDIGWRVIPFGKKITAKIYIDQMLLDVVEISEVEISSLGRI